MAFDPKEQRMKQTNWLGPVVLGLALLAGACNQDAFLPKTARSYDQVQRLGNPLVSEVFLAKRSHPVHGSIGPDRDVALLTAELKGFVANVAGRNATVQNTLAAVLLPDELIIQTDKDPGTAGWLSWALANGWGGRKLTDDVVDAGLDAIFGRSSTRTTRAPGCQRTTSPPMTSRSARRFRTSRRRICRDASRGGDSGSCGGGPHGRDGRYGSCRRSRPRD